MKATMTSRQRIMAALNFEAVDRLPKDLGGMASTGISAFAYPRLVAALGLPPRRTRVHDTTQMLALPEMDVLDALGCDVVSVFFGGTNAFEQQAGWFEYDFGGRLAALVREPELFLEEADGTILQPKYAVKMPPSSTVFDLEHGGQPLDLSAELPKPDLKAVRREQEATLPGQEEIDKTADLCRRARQATDKAVFYNGPLYTGIAISAPGGCAVWPMVCLTEPDFVAEYHALMTEYALRRIELMLPALADNIDIIMLASDDWGTQNALFAPPRIFRELFLPYLRRINDRVHEIAPAVKTFLHSCGAIYEILDMVIEAGFDIINPVQWPAGGRSYHAWKEKCRKRIAMWGGGIDAQHTLPQGSIADVKAEVRDVTACLGKDSGYIFNGIHNLLAETEAGKIIAMYEEA